MSNQVALKDQDGFWILKRREVVPSDLSTMDIASITGSFKFVKSKEDPKPFKDIGESSEYVTTHKPGSWQYRMWDRMHNYVDFNQLDRPFRPYKDFKENLLCILITSKIVGVDPKSDARVTRGPKVNKPIEYLQEYEKYGGYDILRTPNHVKRWTDDVLDIYYNPKSRTRWLEEARAIGFKRARVVFKAMLIYDDMSYTTISGSFGRWMDFFRFQCGDDNKIIFRNRNLLSSEEKAFTMAFPNGYFVTSHKPTREDYEREG